MLGDELFVIIFSIGYGPDKDGKVSMNFGPLNNAGGERRLNVAVSRARQEMYVFSTLKSTDIDLRRSKAKGVEGLKHFLEYAETQTLPTLSQAKTDHSHSVISEEIASELRRHGYQAITNVGRSKFRVDVAIEKNGSPGKFSLGILLDGQNYRDTNTTRDREVVQPSVLRGLNWRVMRVWSVDWFRNKDRVINRIIEKLSEADTDKAEEEEIPAFDVTKEKVEEKDTNAKKYIPYVIDSNEASVLSDLKLMRKIIATEQPITFTHLCRRVSAIRELGRITPSLQKNLGALTGNFFKDSSGALWINEQDSIDYIFYRPDSGRDISDIPEAEIVNSIIETLNEQVALNQDELTLIASKKMGFTRRGINVDAAFRKALETMKATGRIETIGGKVRVKS